MYKTNAIEVSSENAIIPLLQSTVKLKGMKLVRILYRFLFENLYRKRLYIGTRVRSFAGSSTRTYKGIISWFKISQDPLKFPCMGSRIQKYFPSFYCIGTRKGTHIRTCTGSCTVLDCLSNDIKDPAKEPSTYTVPS